MDNTTDVCLQLFTGKSKKGKDYLALGVDLGYRKVYFTFDERLIAECLGISVAQLYKITERR